MAYNFKKVAQDEVSLSPLMSGRQKLTTEEIVNETLTIIAFDLAPKFDKDGTRIIDPLTGEVETFGVVVFAEHPEFYYCTGTVFTKVCRAWATDFDTTEEASAELQASGGVRVVFKQTKTKKGNNIVAVDILD